MENNSRQRSKYLLTRACSRRYNRCNKYVTTHKRKSLVTFFRCWTPMTNRKWVVAVGDPPDEEINELAIDWRPIIRTATASSRTRRRAKTRAAKKRSSLSNGRPKREGKPRSGRILTERRNAVKQQKIKTLQTIQWHKIVWSTGLWPSLWMKFESFGFLFKTNITHHRPWLWMIRSTTAIPGGLLFR